jgi:pantoate--beta-alanine ligase
MVEVAETLSSLRDNLARHRRAGRRIGFVPTMGNLHRGHLSLIEAARERAEATVASIFVNPTQFGPGEDYDAYPRTFEADRDALEEAGCDLIWAPPVAVMYPLEEPYMLRVPQRLADRLCGRSRPGHFDGVASVVLRLFSQVSPDLAVFGEKDFQQLLILRQMVRDLSLPIEIVGAPIVRESDGLAMSSRNAYLSDSERRAAPILHRVLAETAEKLGREDDFDALRSAALETLERAGFRPDYLEWRCAETLGLPKRGRPSRVFGAAWLGRARLIDNVPVGDGA